MPKVSELNIDEPLFKIGDKVFIMNKNKDQEFGEIIEIRDRIKDKPLMNGYVYVRDSKFGNYNYIVKNLNNIKFDCSHFSLKSVNYPEYLRK